LNLPNRIGSACGFLFSQICGNEFLKVIVRRTTVESNAFLDLGGDVAL
jgi:hypothetical protein